jgi:hypothetical protein
MIAGGPAMGAAGVTSRSIPLSYAPSPVASRSPAKPRDSCRS